VIDWSKDAVTPFAPFDNSAGEVSNAYLAHLRAEVAIQAGEHSYSGALRQAFFMLARVLVELRFPPNYRFAVRFLDDEAYRQRILQEVGDPDVRAFFSEAKHTLPKQTRCAATPNPVRHVLPRSTAVGRHPASGPGSPFPTPSDADSTRQLRMFDDLAAREGQGARELSID
jgi:hypothetical protein